MKQSSVLRAAWEKGFSSATRDTAMFPAPLETCDNTDTAQRSHQTPPAPSCSVAGAQNSGRGREIHLNALAAAGTIVFKQDTSDTATVWQKHNTLKVSTISSKADTAGTRERLVQNGKYPRCKGYCF